MALNGLILLTHLQKDEISHSALAPFAVWRQWRWCSFPFQGSKCCCQWTRPLDNLSSPLQSIYSGYYSLTDPRGFKGWVVLPDWPRLRSELVILWWWVQRSAMYISSKPGGRQAAITFCQLHCYFPGHSASLAFGHTKLYCLATVAHAHGKLFHNTTMEWYGVDMWPLVVRPMN